MMPLRDAKLLVRADAGSQVGTGHLMRMIALGQAFQYRGGEVTFVVGDLPGSLIKRIEGEGFSLFRIDNDQADFSDAIDTREIAALIRPDWIALDGYRFDDAYQAAISRTGSRLLVMDDFGHAQHRNADLIVNQNVDGKVQDYPQAACPVLAGSAFTLLREEFWRSWERVTPASDVRRVLVTFGGADPDNWTLRTLQFLADLKRRKLNVDCVLGDCYQHNAELEEFRRHAKLNLRVHRNVQRMDTLMQKADLAVSAAGSTCYELARCGLPAVVVAIADNQRPIAEELHDRGAVLSVDQAAGVVGDRVSRLGQLVDKLLESHPVRQQMACIGQSLIDARGAIRVANRMASMQMPLRAATGEDARTLWRWRNDPEVRAVSFQSEAIGFDHHQNWLGQQLGNPDHLIWIAETTRRQPLGCVRFELQPATGEATISIVIDHRHRCRGIGTVLLNAAVDRLFATTSTREVLARIKPGNDASERAFRSAGFRAIEPVVDRGQMALQYVLARDPVLWLNREIRQTA